MLVAALFTIAKHESKFSVGQWIKYIHICIHIFQSALYISYSYNTCVIYTHIYIFSPLVAQWIKYIHICIHIFQSVLYISYSYIYLCYIYTYIYTHIYIYILFSGGSMVKNLWEIQVRSWGGENTLEKRMGTYSSFLAQRISQTEEHGGITE